MCTVEWRVSKLVLNPVVIFQDNELVPREMVVDQMSVNLISGLRGIHKRIVW
jgi:hypothetical protein